MQTVTENSTGIILRTRLLTETSLIVHWLTPDFGRISTVAKGARRPKSPFAGKLDLFYSADFNFSRSRRSDLHSLRELKLLTTHTVLRTQLAYLRQASYVAALIEHTTERETPLPEIHNLLTQFLEHLPATDPQPRLIYAFELRLLDQLGLFPDLENSRLSQPARNLVVQLRTLPWPDLATLNPTPAQVMELRTFLRRHFTNHLGGIPKARSTTL